MIPFRFGSPQRQMYGVFHPATSNARQPLQGVLLCNPFGQEAVRLHRLYRVLADRLSRSGIPVLRFDYYATGESGGEDEEGEFDGWCQDILSAQKELVQRTRCAQVTWVGARLGATLMILSSEAKTTPVDRLVLWEPVSDGPAYLLELAQAHAKALDNLLQPSRIEVGDSPDGEAIGFGMSSVLIKQLQQLSPTILSKCRAASVQIIDTPNRGCYAELTESLAGRGTTVKTLGLKHAFDWTSEEALNTALVPTEALQLLTDLVEGKRP